LVIVEKYNPKKKKETKGKMRKEKTAKYNHRVTVSSRMLAMEFELSDWVPKIEASRTSIIPQS
jgi:hypothetical protein